MTRRVVVTGIGATSPLGHSLDEMTDGLTRQASGVRVQQAWKDVDGLYTFLGAPVEGAELDFARKKVRGMGRVGLLALRASLDALDDAGLEADDWQNERCGIAFGSTQGSSSSLVDFCTKVIEDGGLGRVRPSTYIQFMSHTCLINLATYLSVNGRMVPTSSACTSGSQGIGFGYEAIKYGMQDRMICGGAEELHYFHAAVFDLMRATSTTMNDQPERSPRPFDAGRDGLVVGEGSGTLILESLESAVARDAHIYCEVAGYGTTCDGNHLTAPDQEGMASAMRAALADADVPADTIDYVNAHATATHVGDVCESRATAAVFGADIAVSSTKGLTGHTLGACGALESIFCIAAIQDGFLPPNYNLDELDDECAALDYVTGEARSQPVDRVMNNNFAFGGINTSLIFARM